MTMSNYWKNRAINLENLIQEKTDEAVIKINELYSNSVKTINGHIEKIFNTYKNGGKIDREYALQLLSAGQTEKQRQELLEKLSKTTDKTAKQKIINILNAPAYADRISRLQALKNMVRAEAVTLGVNESDITTDNLINTSKESYYRTLYNDQIQCGKAYNFNTLSDKRLKAMLSQKWSGKNYSSRIWKNNDDFINRLEQTLEMGCLTGLSINEMEDVILNDCIGANSNEAQRFCASRLIRTETNHFANQGILMGYQQAGIERYRFLATLDIHTSEKCRSLDSKVFLVSEAETGVNLPPMHPFCRSITVPDTASRNGTRWARDPVTGKSITVPADMTYQQWYDKYVKKTVENNMDYGIIRLGSESGLDVKIDKFTPCLENAETGEIVETTYALANESELRKLKGWNFDWLANDLKNTEIYKLQIKGDSEIQGLVSLTRFDRDNAIYVNIAESAPHNLGHNKKYNGVGGHLFAIAAQTSKDLGYGGFVFMDAKNVELVNHYRDTLGAQFLGIPHPYRMFIDEDAAERLLKIYTMNKEGL